MTNIIQRLLIDNKINVIAEKKLLKPPIRRLKLNENGYARMNGSNWGWSGWMGQKCCFLNIYGYFGT